MTEAYILIVDDDPSIVQLHSSEYLGPSQLREGSVLLVGAGNSGAEISFELSRTHPTLLAGKEHGHIPARHGSIPFRFLFRIVRFIGYRVLTTSTPIGRKVRPKFVAGGAPLIRDLREGGVCNDPGSAAHHSASLHAAQRPGHALILAPMGLDPRVHLDR